VQRPRAMVPFGRFLSARRRAKNLTAAGVVRRMKNFGVQLDQSTLYNYEAGTVSAPDPGVLWALSKIYDMALDELIALLVGVRNGKVDAPPPSILSRNPQFDESEEKLVLAFRGARVEAKRRILDFVEYEAHKRRRHAGETSEETALRKRGRST